VAARLTRNVGRNHMINPYDTKYDQETYYWGVRPCSMCFDVLKLLPPDRPLRLLDIGCGEGRHAVFFARNGYEVSAFDLSEKGVEKTRLLADRCRVQVKVFRADLNWFRLEEEYDILFSTGVLHHIPASNRQEIFENYKCMTRTGGLNAFSVFVTKPFIEPAPDVEPTAHK